MRSRGCTGTQSRQARGARLELASKVHTHWKRKASLMKRHIPGMHDREPDKEEEGYQSGEIRLSMSDMAGVPVVPSCVRGATPIQLPPARQPGAPGRRLRQHALLIGRNPGASQLHLRPGAALQGCPGREACDGARSRVDVGRGGPHGAALNQSALCALQPTRCQSAWSSC